MSRRFPCVDCGRPATVAVVGASGFDFRCPKCARKARQTCACGTPCSRADGSCAGPVVATRYAGREVAEHLCERHRKAREGAKAA